MDHADTIDIAAAPVAAFAALSDLASMGRRSPENTGGQWLNGDGPALGARFRGDNTHGDDSWSTVATVTEYDPPRRFAFEVKYGVLKVSRWAFDVEATDAGCRVTEHWRDQRGYLLKRDAAKNDYDRVEFTRESIRTTLENLKRELEATAS
ncbi:MAG: SRPBCC family protein [Acidimicrobiales bacterium]